MNKELTPLQALNKIANIEMKEQYKVDKGGFVYRVVSDEYSKELKVIEKALKEKETPTETFEQFVGEPSEVIYKKLKALEIIKNKKVDMKNLLGYFEWANGFSYYNEYCLEEEKLIQEEYELLKEILE